MNARRWWGKPLKPLYGAGLALKNGLRAVGVGKTKELTWPVISVGSVSAGGAGKTPVVIALAEILKAQGRTVDVLSRGYQRSGKGNEPVEAADAGRYGDEPVLIWKAAGVPVWVGSDRHASGLLAEAQGGEKGVHLLDDGFQHRKLRRTIDIVVLTTADLDDELLPAGNLRERPDAMERADVLVMQEKEFKRIRPRIGRMLRPATSIWLMRRKLRFPGPLGAQGAGPRPLAFCGIARPVGFSSMLSDAGTNTAKTMAFDDHHRFTKLDIENIVASAKRRSATGFFTTEKDAVKLSPALLAMLEEVGPVVAVGLDVEFVDRERVEQELAEMLG
jgi:tetraacyldisaccharide 4'-kinase